MNPFFVTDFSISDSLKTVRKSVLIYETIIVLIAETDPSIQGCCRNHKVLTESVYGLKLKMVFHKYPEYKKQGV